MKVLIISGGDLGDPQWIKKNLPRCDFVICADRGAHHMESLDIKPDLLVGDFDSISPHVLDSYKKKGIPVINYPVEKDKTDTHIAVDLAIEKGATHVYLLGALGNRWDHSYANVMLLYRLENNGVKGQILHSNNIIMLSNKLLEIEGEIGQYVSLLPFAGEAYITSTEGLKYPIYNSVLPPDITIGISNVLTASRAVVRIKSGWVISVLAHD